MSGPVEVPEVERLREQVRRLEEREAGHMALLESYGRQVDGLHEDLNAEIMERAAMGVRADRDRMTIDLLTRSAGEHFADVQRARIMVQQANAAVERLEAATRRLRIGALVSADRPFCGDEPIGVVLSDPADGDVWVWWDSYEPGVGAPQREMPAHLTVRG